MDLFGEIQGVYVHVVVMELIELTAYYNQSVNYNQLHFIDMRKINFSLI